MIRHFLIILTVLAAATGGVAAVDNATENATDALEDDRDDDHMFIDDGIYLVDASIDDGHAVLTFTADRRERVTLIEAVRLDEHREINRESFVLQSDRETTVRLPIDTSSPTAGVFVDTQTRLQGVPIKTSDPLVGGPYDASDAQAAGLGGAIGVAFITLLLVLRTVYGRDEGAERVA